MIIFKNIITLLLCLGCLGFAPYLAIQILRDKTTWEDRAMRLFIPFMGLMIGIFHTIQALKALFY